MDDAERKPFVLFSMLVEDLGSVFLRQFAQRTAVTYKESEGRSKHESVHPAFQSYYYGWTRFTLHQTMLLRLADDCKLSSSIERCPQNGFPTAVVRIGRFFFTTHYGSTPQEILHVNSSVMRKQNAGINESLVQPSLFERRFDESKLRQANNIYANLIHGCRGAAHDFNVCGFLRIAFPCAIPRTQKDISDRSIWFVENYDLNDILARVIERERIESSRLATTAVAPRLKQEPKLKEEAK